MVAGDIGGREAFGGDPVEPLVAARQDVVVDVQAASRHGEAADIALVRSTILTDGRLMTVSSQLPVFERDGEFSLVVSVPVGFVKLEDGGDFTVVVLLPRPTNTYDIRLLRWTTDYDPQVFDGLENPRIGGRIAVAWRGTGSLTEIVWEAIPVGR